MVQKIGTWVAVAAFALVTVGCAKHNDPATTAKVKEKLAADQAATAYKIDVATNDGVVTLVGAVPDEAAKAHVIEIARGTEGVASVVDQVTVTPGPAAVPTSGVAAEPSPDEALAGKVKTIILADPAVSALKIDVDAKDGVVTLTGIVPTAAEKTQLGNDAKTAEGVTSVKNDLKVDKKAGDKK